MAATLSPVKLKELFYQKQLRPLPNFLNLWSIEDNAVVGVDLQMSFVYEYIGSDLINKTESEIDVFFQAVKNFLHSIPENVTVQFVIQTRIGDQQKVLQYQDNLGRPQDEFAKYIIEQKIKYLMDLPVYRKRYLMYITTYPENVDLNKLSFNILKSTVPNYKKYVTEVHQRRIEQLIQTSNVLIEELKTLGIKVRQLNEREIAQMLYEYLNPGRTEYLDFNHLDKEHTLRSQIVFNACENQFDYTYIDGYYFRAVNMHTRPTSIIYSQLIELTQNLTGEYDLVVSIHSISQDKLVKQLQATATQSSIIANINPFKRYHEAELKARHSSELVEYSKGTFQKLFQTSFCIIIRDISLESLTRKTNSAVTTFRTLGEAEGVIDDMNHFYLYISVLPNHSQLNLRKHIFHTEAVAQILPLHQKWIGSKEPKMLLITRENEFLPIDLFDPRLPAKHGLILGTTGSGKSFTTNFLLTNFYVQSEKNHIVVIDIGGSYRKLSSMLKGQYLEIELSEKYSFNPFSPKSVAVLNPDPTKFELDPDILGYLKMLIQKMVTDKEHLTGEEVTIIEHAIINTYRYTNYDPPILSNLHYQLARYTPKGMPEQEQITPTDTDVDIDTKKIAYQFAKNLQMWTSGSYGKMLNRADSIKPDARLIVFDLQKLQEHQQLQSIIFFLIQNVIWSKLQDKSLQKIIVFDECWKFFNDKISAELIENLYRTARKFNAMILSISQSPEDFLASTASSAVISNSYTKYILRLQKGHEVLEKFQITEPEIREIKSLTSIRRKYSEIFVKFLDDSRVVRIQEPPSDYWICTTDAEDYAIEQKIREKNPGASELDILKKLVEYEEVSLK